MSGSPFRARNERATVSRDGHVVLEEGRIDDEHRDPPATLWAMAQTETIATFMFARFQYELQRRQVTVAPAAKPPASVRMAVETCAECILIAQAMAKAYLNRGTHCTICDMAGLRAVVTCSHSVLGCRSLQRCNWICAHGAQS